MGITLRPWETCQIQERGCTTMTISLDQLDVKNLVAINFTSASTNCKYENLCNTEILFTVASLKGTRNVQRSEWLAN